MCNEVNLCKRGLRLKFKIIFKLRLSVNRQIPKGSQIRVAKTVNTSSTRHIFSPDRYK